MIVTNEEKQLLLKDLCARLPYGVIVRGVFLEYNKDVDKIQYEVCDRELDFKHLLRFQTLKPYLRPMSSMTNEEKSWYKALRNALTYQENGEYNLDDFNELNDFLNRRKLDKYGLIDKGLALEAPEGMYD